MNANANLFNLDPYTARSKSPVAPRQRRRLAMKPTVWLALASLKTALDEVPETEGARRRRVYDASLRSQ